jgi:hypothetical protein
LRKFEETEIVTEGRRRSIAVDEREKLSTRSGRLREKEEKHLNEE